MRSISDEVIYRVLELVLAIAFGYGLIRYENYRRSRKPSPALQKSTGDLTINANGKRFKGISYLFILLAFIMGGSMMAAHHEPYPDALVNDGVVIAGQISFLICLGIAALISRHAKRLEDGQTFLFITSKSLRLFKYGKEFGSIPFSNMQNAMVSRVQHIAMVGIKLKDSHDPAMHWPVLGLHWKINRLSAVDLFLPYSYEWSTEEIVALLRKRIALVSPPSRPKR